MIILSLNLKKIKNSDGKYSHVQDMYIHNIIYRSTESEHMSYYDMVTHNELRKMNKKRIESLNCIVKSKTSFNLLGEHPSHKCMTMVKINNLLIPCINSINLLPNIADLSINHIATEVHILKKREEHTKFILLLFYHYRIQDDSMLNDSYWNRFILALDNDMISVKGL